MRAVVQRVTEAHVVVDGREVGRIGAGFVVLLGVGRDDGPADVEAVSAKVAELRVFEDAEGKMNRALGDTGGSVLLVSQFTLFGDVRKGRRPSFIDAAPPDLAVALYEDVARALRARGVPTETGVFRADMRVALVNDGPVTI
ncbi:MAG: D-tyrosyl-tRNA(Tyr) deacylase, partial [Acidobacteria bacterium]|nr:D-tyrosyl-tRNA(Tyr) deacylase [Acidobacteriota bacterium]